MTCRDVVEFLMAYLSGELCAEERALFDAHLAECDECVAFLTTYRKAVALGREVLAPPETPADEKLPQDLVRAILEARRLPP